MPLLALTLFASLALAQSPGSESAGAFSFTRPAGWTRALEPGVTCTMFYWHWRSPTAVAFLAVALDSTVPVRGDSSWTEARRVRGPKMVNGFYVRIRGGTVTGADSTVVVVYWGLQGDCSRVAMRGPPASAGLQHYVAHVRPEAEWVNGTPVVEVGIGHWTIYPIASPAPSGTKASDMLTPAEFADFYRALPTGAEVNADCAKANTPLHQWALAHRGLARRYPAKGVLEFSTCKPPP